MSGRLLLIGFFVIQILFDLGHSVTAFPFVHYGMFSEAFRQPDSLLVFEITVDGRRLDPQDFRIYPWDMVQTPLQAFDRQTQTRDARFDKDKLRSGLQFIGAGALYRLAAPNLDNAPATAVRFPDWYKTYLSRMLGRPIRTLQVEKAWYREDHGHLLLLKTDPWINL